MRLPPCAGRPARRRPSLGGRPVPRRPVHLGLPGPRRRGAPSPSAVCTASRADCLTSAPSSARNESMRERIAASVVLLAMVALLGQFPGVGSSLMATRVSGWWRPVRCDLVCLILALFAIESCRGLARAQYLPVERAVVLAWQ